MYLLGTKIHSISLDKALAKAEGFLNDGKQHYIVTPNPEIVMRARTDRAFRNILNKSSLSIPDGSGIVWASKFLGGGESIEKRIAGIDFMNSFLEHLHTSKSRQYRILLAGGRNSSAKQAAENLGRKYSRLKFFSWESVESERSRHLIRNVIQPDIIFVAMGAPKQEIWMYKNLKFFPTAKIAMGVGGSLDFISARVPRAPKVFQNAGFEWMWRLMVQPWRAGRVFNAVVAFPLAVAREKFSHKNL